MGIVDRVSRAIAVADIDLNPHAVEATARRILRRESPWTMPVREVVSNVIGWGPLQPLFDDPDVSDILVNSPNVVWVDRGGSLETVDVAFETDESVVNLVERMIAPLGLRIDRSSPMVEARLEDGSRLHAAIPPAAVDGPVVAIRRFTQRVKTLSDLVDSGFATADQVHSLHSAVVDRRTVVISGGTGTGKTTLLNLLGTAIPANQRVVTIEDAAELSLPGHVVRLEARAPNTEGAGEITIRSLLRSALRLRPDRVIVGEVRGPEALDLITALNTGHEGSMTTVHANSPEEAFWRLETLALTAGNTSESAVRRQLRAAIDVVVQLSRLDGVRRISEISGLEEKG